MTDEKLIRILRDADCGDVCDAEMALAAARIEQLVNERVFILQERDCTFTLMLTRAEAAEKQVEELLAAHENMCNLWAKEAAEKQVLVSLNEELMATISQIENELMEMNHADL